MVGIVTGEQHLHKRWKVTSALFGIAMALATIPFLMPLHAFLELGPSKQTFTWIAQYFLTLFTNPLYWVAEYKKWIINSSFIPLEFISSLMIGIGMMAYRWKKNPYDHHVDHHGVGRLANDRDVAKTGLLDGFIIVLGEWKKKFLKLPETLSVLCVAPPGTGKTVGIVVPTILSCDDISMIINDVKPELFDITSGYKSQTCVCLRLEWSARDIPEKNIFFPRWNPLSPLSMPPQGATRDLYIDRLVTVLIPEPAGSADPHWTLKARAALSGIIHYITSKCEAGRYDNIPDEWFGEEPSLPMLLDWFTMAQLNSADEIERMKQKDPNAALFADPVKNFLLAAVKEVREHNYSPRALLELTQLANTPDKERGSILSTMDSGLTIFKNSAVRARTSKSDFSFADVRGIKDPKTGEVKPLCIYISVNQEDSRALGVITGLFVEALSAWLVAHKPNGKTKDGKTVGPFPTLFVLDEFPQMPKLDALINGPAVGRGQKVSYLMIGQDLGQISAVYGNDNLETIFSTTAAKIVLPLNNEVTAQRFTKMIGQTNAVSSSWNKTEGWGADVNPFKKSMSWQNIAIDTVNHAELMSIPRGKHIVIFQQHSNKPIYADTPFYFENEKLKDLVSPKFGGKYEPAKPMPDWMIEKRIAEEKSKQEFLSLVGPRRNAGDSKFGRSMNSTKKQNQTTTTPL